jgi:stringent starvation protein B
MEPLKPYLVRALYEWILDNQCTPYLLVDAESPGAVVPEGFVEEGRIVLNLRPEAIQRLDMSNELITFSARFGGNPTSVIVPMPAVLALYAKENGRGMVFEEEPQAPEGPPEPPGPSPAEPRARPALRVVK